MGASFRPKACRKAVRRALKADQLVLAAALLSAGLMQAPTQGRLLRQAALLARRRRNQLVVLGLTRPAQGWVLLALRRRPGDAPLLRTARDLWRASGDRWRALAFSARLRRLPAADAHDASQEVELLVLAGRTRQARWRVGGALRRYPRDKESCAWPATCAASRGSGRPPGAIRGRWCGGIPAVGEAMRAVLRICSPSSGRWRPGPGCSGPAGA